MSKFRIALVSVVTVLFVIVGWRLLFSGVSRAALVDAALMSEESAARQQAALSLIAFDNSPAELADLMTKSDDPAVRAIFVQGMAEKMDFAIVEQMFGLLEDSNPVVRASASGSLGRLMRCATNFPVNGTDKERAQSIEQIRDRWETLKRFELLDELASSPSLAYFYDQHTKQLFAAPSTMPDAFELPSGPYKGAPAAVKASVFSNGDCRDASQRFIGWLSVDDEILKKHGAALPAAPDDGESTLVKRVDDTEWVYAASAKGSLIMDRVFKKNSNGSSLRPCRPGN